MTEEQTLSKTNSTTATTTSNFNEPADWVSYLSGAGVALLVVFIIWGGVTITGEMTQKKIQAEYLNLTDEASRASFSKRYSAHPLGGLVLLGQAHNYYEDGNYTAAQAAYAQAAKSGLKNQSVFYEEALLGEAFSSYRVDEKKGLEALKTLAQNNKLMDSTRALAAYELAGYWVQKNDTKQAKDYLALIRVLKNARPWQIQAESLTEIYPALK